MQYYDWDNLWAISGRNGFIKKLWASRLNICSCTKTPYNNNNINNNFVPGKKWNIKLKQSVLEDIKLSVVLGKPLSIVVSKDTLVMKLENSRFQSKENLHKIKSFAKYIET